mmetsp:Transcript_29225/g.77216  ORF Transcript_29225/g.77216 Transcript_29225/m.77216 type:complete len:262 (+) Transcript_29225:598-1383(+)
MRGVPTTELFIQHEPLVDGLALCRCDAGQTHVAVLLLCEQVLHKLAFTDFLAALSRKRYELFMIHQGFAQELPVAVLMDPQTHIQVARAPQPAATVVEEPLQLTLRHLDSHAMVHAADEVRRGEVERTVRPGLQLARVARKQTLFEFTEVLVDEHLAVVAEGQDSFLQNLREVREVREWDLFRLAQGTAAPGRGVSAQSLQGSVPTILLFFVAGLLELDEGLAELAHLVRLPMQVAFGHRLDGRRRARGFFPLCRLRRRFY